MSADARRFEHRFRGGLLYVLSDKQQENLISNRGDKTPNSETSAAYRYKTSHLHSNTNAEIRVFSERFPDYSIFTLRGVDCQSDHALCLARYRKMAHPCNKQQEANLMEIRGMEIASLDSNITRFKRQGNLSFAPAVDVVFDSMTCYTLVVPALIMPVRYVFPRPRRRGRMS